MAEKGNQKLKLLEIQRMFELHTDSEHGLSISDIVKKLEAKGLSAERKSIYSDIELLRSFGMDIEKVNVNGTEYRLMSRSFQLAELKLLVDSVGASRFITRKKSLELIKKLECLASVYEARELRRSIYVDNRIKTMNESIYYTVDTIHAAINSDKRLSFKYFRYRIDKQRVFGHGGAAYIVSPLALTFSDENYYLYAYGHDTSEIRIYRVDRMVNACPIDKARELPSEISNFDPASQSNEMFSMFGGERKNVTLTFNESLAGVVIDRFGSDVILVPLRDGRFSVSVDVMVSPTFLGWVFGFGENAVIESPPDVAEQFSSLAARLSETYAQASRSSL